MTTTTTTADVLVLDANPRQPMEKFRKDYRPTEYSIKHAEIIFDLDENSTEVDSTLTIFRKDGVEPCDLRLDGVELICEYLSLEGRELPLTSQGVTIRDAHGDLVLSQALLPSEPGKTFELRSKVRINPRKNLQLMGLFMSNDILLTQCEAEGFRRITYFLDRPDVMSSFKVTLRADSTRYPVLLSNGNCIERGTLEGGRSFAVFLDPFLKPCYLFALVAGSLAHKEDTYQHPARAGGKRVKLGVYCEPEESSKLDWALKSIKRAMQWDEDRFGLEYDLNVFNLVCVRDFNMGAMENKSLNVFLSSLLLATKDTATDSDFLRILGVVGHEYFHNWTGDRVTCRDWFQLTLKEGLTVFRDQEFSQDMGSRAVGRIEDVQLLRSRQFPEDAGPLSHPIRPESYLAMDNFYTLTVYEKGAEVIRMYQTLFGVDGFRKGVDLYFKRHDGQAVTCDDFRSAMADANDRDLSQFERWYSQSGTPVVTVSECRHDPKKSQYIFQVSQSCPPQKEGNTAKPLHIPIAIGLISRSDGHEVSPTQIFELSEGKQIFIIEGVKQDCVVSVMRGFSAPVKLRFDQSDDDLAFLMAHDTDAFNRWESGQKLMMRLIVDRIAAEGPADSSATLPPVVVAAFKRILERALEDPGVTALALCLPGEDSIAQETIPADPCRIHNVRDSLRRQLRSQFKSDLMKLYETMSQKLEGRPYDVNPDDVGARSLRNTVLSLLTSDRGTESEALAFKHFETGQNLTDRIAALRALASSDTPCKKIAFDKFYEEGKGDHQLLDKWFSLEAMADYDGVLERVKELKTTHPEFSMKTPPRMRSLLIAFAMNRPQFHREDGKGYEFIGDIVLELDQFNAQVASRTCGMLTNFQQYEPIRRELMKSQLERILNAGNLSADTVEIVMKALGKQLSPTP